MKTASLVAFLFLLGVFLLLFSFISWKSAMVVQEDVGVDDAGSFSLIFSPLILGVLIGGILIVLVIVSVD